MACGLQPAAAAAALWPRDIPSLRRSAAAAGKGRRHQFACTNQPDRKLAFSAAESHRYRNLLSCTCSGAHIVISGYWTGPDIDDGCGHVQAILQRIV